MVAHRKHLACVGDSGRCPLDHYADGLCEPHYAGRRAGLSVDRPIKQRRREGGASTAALRREVAQLRSLVKRAAVWTDPPHARRKRCDPSLPKGRCWNCEADDVLGERVGGE